MNAACHFGHACHRFVSRGVDCDAYAQTLSRLHPYETKTVVPRCCVFIAMNCKRTERPHKRKTSYLFVPDVPITQHKTKCYAVFMWTYGIALWGCASKSNISVIQRYQSKLLRTIKNAPWYVTNQTLHSDLRILYVHSVLQDYIHKHRSALEVHSNPLVEPLLHTTHTRRLKRRWTFDVIN